MLSFARRLTCRIPALRMGVAIKTNIFQKQTAGDILLFFTFLLRNIDGQNLPAYFFHLFKPPL